MSMQKHNNISSLWEIMSQEKSVGLVKRLLPSSSPLKVFATYKYPENMYLPFVVGIYTLGKTPNAKKTRR